MNTHDTFARIANILGGIPANLEAGIKEVIAQHAAHHRAAAVTDPAAPASASTKKRAKK